MNYADEFVTLLERTIQERPDHYAGVCYGMRYSPRDDFSEPCPCGWNQLRWDIRDLVRKYKLQKQEGSNNGSE